MIKIGTDICSVQRVSKAYNRFGNRLLQKILTPQEIEDILSNPSQISIRLAGRIAAKEATFKALGTGWMGVHWKEIEVLKDSLGAPYLRLHERALSLASQKNLSCWEISISHEIEHAVAFVLAHGT